MTAQTIAYAQSNPGRFSVLLPVKGDGQRAYVIDAAPFLGTSVLASASATTLDASLTVSDVSNTDTAVSFTVGAGNPGTLALITVSFVTTEGDIETFAVGQPLAGRPPVPSKPDAPAVTGGFFNADGHLIFIRSDSVVFDVGAFPIPEAVSGADVAVVTATGTTAGTATPAAAAIIIVTTCPDGAGVMLTGLSNREIINRSAVNLTVYPPPGGTIEGQASAFIAPGASATFVAPDDLHFYAF